ncbi:MAG: PDZ domain-containing protein [Ruminococcaceae bacterium]|nr:PDZ domain-containing protein [Oscillospiraceae bacterium]
MNKKISVGIAISLMAVVAAIAIAFTYSVAMNTFESRMSAITERQSINDLINEIDNKIRQQYSGEVTDESIREGLASGYVDGLGDEFCRYFSAEDWDLETSRNSGSDFGLGINVSRATSGNIQVNRVTPGSPAAKAGLVKGDIITRVSGMTVLAMGYDNALAIMNDSSSVEITIEREGKWLKLTKSWYDTVTVEYKTVDDIGYISISSFNATTHAQFNSALNKLRQSKVTGLIIDLRNNSGGGYEYACDIMDTILPACRMMITTDRSGNETVARRSDADALDMPICVLINGQTSGAAELFASAAADCGIKLVGNPTYGHMTVQEDFELSDGSALRLTTSSWSTTSGKAVVDGVVVPDTDIVLSSYQQSNFYLLSAEDDPHIMEAVKIIDKQVAEGYVPPVAEETSGSDVASKSDTAE